MTYDRCKCILSHIMKSFSRAEKSSLKLYSFYPCNIRFFKQKRKKKSKFKPLGEHTNGFALQLFRYSILKPII